MGGQNDFNPYLAKSSVVFCRHLVCGFNCNLEEVEIHAHNHQNFSKNSMNLNNYFLQVEISTMLRDFDEKCAPLPAPTNVVFSPCNLTLNCRSCYFISDHRFSCFLKSDDTSTLHVKYLVLVFALG